MAKITDKQIDTINAMCRNGFRFDRHDFAVLGEKRLSKTITLVEDEMTVQVKINWQEEIVERTNGYGCTVPTFTGNVIPQHCTALYGTNQPVRIVGTVTSWGNSARSRTGSPRSVR